jgi:hypothetical protein
VGRKLFPLLNDGKLNYHPTWKINSPRGRQLEPHSRVEPAARNFFVNFPSLSRIFEMCEHSSWRFKTEARRGGGGGIFSLSRSPSPSSLANATWKIYNRRRKKRDKTGLNSAAHTGYNAARYSASSKGGEGNALITLSVLIREGSGEIRCLHYCRFRRLRCRSSFKLMRGR